MRNWRVFSSALAFGLLTGAAARSRVPLPAPAVSHVKPAEAAGSGAPAPSAAKAAAPAGAARPKQPLNVLFISVDSLRADMPWTGYSREIAPNLTALAKESVVYTNAYSVSSYTAKSVAACSRAVIRRASTARADFSPTTPKPTSFSPRLCRARDRTIGWHGHMYFGRGKGLEQGFESGSSRRASRSTRRRTSTDERQADEARHRAARQVGKYRRPVLRLGPLHGPARRLQQAPRVARFRQQGPRQVRLGSLLHRPVDRQAARLLQAAALVEEPP